jgi:cobalt-zinc-cadmium efflux system outer membrane protein
LIGISNLHIFRLPALVLIFTGCLCAQKSLTWQEVRDQFEKTNPTLQAALMSVDESKAVEITAYLRPNPDFSFSMDGTQLTPYLGVHRPFAGTQMSPSISYLHERQRKREFRLESAKTSTDIANPAGQSRVPECQ